MKFTGTLTGWLLERWRGFAVHRGQKAKLLAHQLATGHRGIYRTFYHDGSVAEHCVECEYGLPDPR